MDGYNFKNYMDCEGVTLKTLKGLLIHLLYLNLYKQQCQIVNNLNHC